MLRVSVMMMLLFALKSLIFFFVCLLPAAVCVGVRSGAGPVQAGERGVPDPSRRQHQVCVMCWYDELW